MVKTRPRVLLSDPCVRLTAGVFGFLLLLAVLFVPCTKSVTRVRPDPSGTFVTKTTTHRGAYLFLPGYLARKSRSGPGDETVRVKTLQWTAVIAGVALLGVFDTVLVCWLFRKRRNKDDDEDGLENGEEDTIR
jgi:hypothetical protein